jgi:hypothetical protein
MNPASRYRPGEGHVYRDRPVAGLAWREWTDPGAIALIVQLPNMEGEWSMGTLTLLASAADGDASEALG